jgi:general stress protein YciG
MTPEHRRGIARMGGKAAQRQGKAHRWSRAEAIEAGRRGGKVSVASGNGYKWNSTTAKKANSKRKRR